MAINIVDNTITYQKETYAIRSWVVWFMTPFGLFQERPDAIARVTESDLDPLHTVIPVPVALSDNNLYEVYGRI